MSVAPRLIRCLIDNTIVAIEVRLTPGQWLPPAGHSEEFDRGYQAAQDDAQAWLSRTMLPPLRAIRQWANNEAKVADLSRRFGGGK